MQQHKNGDAPHQDAATAVSHFHTHSVPLDMEDIRRDWDKPISEAGLAAKTSVVVRVGALDLGAGTGSFRVREMMHRIAYPLGVHVRADVNLTDIEATCTDDANRITEVIDLPTTGVNTERIWLLEHYTDWFSVNLGLDSMYHRAGDVSEGVVQNLEQSDMSEVSAQLAKKLRAEKKAQKELSGEASDDPVLDALEAAEVTVPVSMVRAAAADITAEGSTDDELRSESEAALKEDREAKLLHDRLMQQRSGKHDFVETPDLDAAAAAAGGTGADAGAGASASSAEDQNLNEFGTSMSAEALLGAKRRKTRAHKPLTGEYAEHFDHVGRSAGEGRKPITVRQAHERLDLIESRKPLYSPAFAGFASAVACASFVFLLGGGPYDMIGAFVGAGLGHWLRRKLFARHLNQFFVTFVCVALAALACTGTLRLIGLQPGCKTLSSLFLMLPQYTGQPLGFADCSVVPQPTAAQLADIAIASAETWQAIAGEAPRVAMLSFSTHGSARHHCVANVQQATEIVRQRAPQLMVDGELQFDAAFVPDVAAHKAPGSPLQGRANVLVFPSLEAGNIGYKIAQRLGGYRAIGPLIQGLAAPLHDLSRGCSVEEIIELALVASVPRQTDASRIPDSSTLVE